MRNPEAHPFTSERLKAMIDNPIAPRQPLIENLLYEKSVMMIYADPAAGKSILTLCAAVQACSGHNVFGFFEPVRPLKIYYCLTERGIEEPAERLQLMAQAMNINYDNIFIDEETIGLNVLNREDEMFLINRINRFCPNPDIIVFDPIYAMVRGGLSNPDDATLFAQFSSRIQNRFNCANWLTNHTLKSTTDFIAGKMVNKSDPFFGSQLLKAHVTGMYHVTRNKRGVSFQLKKDSHNILLENFNLNFDPERYILNYDTAHSDITAKKKMELFINTCKINQKSFTYSEFFEAIKPASTRYTRNLLCVMIEKNIIKNHNSSFQKALYTVL